MPCMEPSCGLLECTQYKDSLGLPNVDYTFRPFNSELTGVPRTVLHMLAGGHLELLCTVHAQHSPQGLLIQFLSVLMIWGHFVQFLVNMDSMWSSWQRMKPQARQFLRNRMDDEGPSVRLPGRVAIDFVSFIFKLGSVGTTLFSVFVGLCYLFVPFLGMHESIIKETSDWKTWNSSTPCPALWKDDLEDVLWWF
jgi:hypothetical protein